MADCNNSEMLGPMKIENKRLEAVVHKQNLHVAMMFERFKYQVLNNRYLL